MIRALRTLLYEFDSYELMHEHMQRLAAPANGEFSPREGISIKSSWIDFPFELPLEIVEDNNRGTNSDGISYAKDDPCLVANDDGEVIGVVTQWNPHGIGEAIVQFFNGSADSAIFKELNFPNGKNKARDYLNS